MKIHVCIHTVAQALKRGREYKEFERCIKGILILQIMAFPEAVVFFEVIKFDYL